jgi:hypothetical protein
MRAAGVFAGASEGRSSDGKSHMMVRAMPDAFF